MGRRCCDSQITLGHLPKTPCLYFSICDQLDEYVKVCSEWPEETYHLRKASRSHHIARMHKAVEMPCALLNLLSHIIVDLHVEDISYEIQRILVILDLGV